MVRRVHTPDGVAWTVTVGRPRWRARGADLTVGRVEEEAGFGPILVVAPLILLLVLTPVWVETDRWWVFLLVPVLLVGVWLLFARYPVELRRAASATPVHRTLVAGRRRAARVADELAAEIERTPDERLG